MITEYRLSGVTKGIIVYDPSMLFSQYDRMDLQTFVINLDLLFQYRSLSLDSLCSSLPKNMIDKIFTSIYVNLLPQYQISFLEKVYIPLLLYLNKTQKIRNHVIVSPLQAFNINMLTFSTMLSTALNEILYVDWYTEFWTIMDWDNILIQPDSLIQIQNLVVEKSLSVYTSYLTGLHNIFSIDFSGTFVKENALYYGKSLISTMIPALSQQMCDIYFTAIEELKEYVGLRGYTYDQKLEFFDDMTGVLREHLL